MDKKKETIEAYNDLLFSVYQENELVCLPDAQFTYKGRNVLGACNAAVVAMVEASVNTRLDEVTDLLKLPRFNLMHAENEILSVSADIKYRLGSLYLYLPYTVKLHQSHYPFNEETQYFHEPTRFDARFNREVPIAFEALYKFWQRLMDYMLSFFPEEVLRVQGKSYFHNFVNYIGKHQPQLAISENFKWLKDFAENNYPLINQRRKHFVHAEGYENQFFRDFLDSDTTSLDDMLKLEEQREELLPFLKSQMTLSLDGYFKAMDFLNELDFTRDEQTGSFVYSLSNEMSGQN